LHWPSARAAQALPGTLPCGARTFLDALARDATVRPTPPRIVTFRPSGSHGKKAAIAAKFSEIDIIGKESTAMRSPIVIVSLLLFAASSIGVAHAQDGQGPFVGTLGKSAIVLRLYTNDGKKVGRYFYRAKGVDIGLIANGHANEYIECPLGGGNNEPDACDKPTGYWTLSVQGDSANGTWRKTPQATDALPVALTRQCEHCANASDSADAIEKTYAQLRAVGPTQMLPKQSSSDDGAVTWQFMQEKRSGATIPQLVKAPAVDAMRKINDNLKHEFTHDIDAALSSKPDGEASCDYSIPFADAHIFVVDSACEWDTPGAAHPSSSWGTVTYDLATGVAIDWTQWLRFPDASADHFDFTTGKDIVSLALRHEASKRNDGDCTQAAFESYSCDGNTCSNEGHGGNWKDAISFSPRKNGLFVAFNEYPEVARNCRGEGFTLPWNAIHAVQTKPRDWP
jgi:hypothetical protein